MKRTVLILVACLWMVSIYGCQNTAEPSETPEETVAGQLYDTGEFAALVPEGWSALPITDVFGEDPNAVKTDCFFVIQGGETEKDLHSKIYIRLEHFGPEDSMELPNRDEYKNVVDISPMRLGDHIWYGFTCDEYQGRVCLGKFFLLWTTEGDHRYFATGTLEWNNQKISLTDPELQMLLAGVAPSE